jgi:hypothetical protein
MEAKQGSWRAVGLVAAGVLFFVFWHNPLLWPAKILVVLFHELSHAIAAWLTGGSVLSIGLSPDQGGVTMTQGGVRFVILNAGYLGSMLWGLGLLRAAKSPKTARIAIGGLAALLFVVTFLFVRPILSFGFPFALLTVVGLAVATRYGTAGIHRSLLDGLGVFSVLYAALDIRDDVLSFGTTGTSDATMLAELTMIPAVFWGIAWIGVGGVMLWVTRKWWT